MSTKERLRDEALRLFLENGYSATPLSAIAAACGIKKPSMYNHYSSKEELGRAVLEHLAHAEILSELPKLPPRELIFFFVCQEGPEQGNKLHSRESLILELLHYFPEYSKKNQHFLELLQTRLEQYFENQRKAGTVGPQTDPKSLSWELLCIPHGMRLNKLSARNLDTRPILEHIAESIWNCCRP